MLNGFKRLPTALLPLGLGFLLAAGAQGGTGLTTCQFLTIGAGARASGLAGAFTAGADDASAIYWNPAGIGQIDNHRLQFSHFEWYQDLRFENLNLVIPIGALRLGAGASYLGYGDIESFDQYGYPGEPISAHSLAGTITLAFQLRENLTVGLSGKYIEQSLELAQGRAFAMDAGLQVGFGRLRLGLAALNFGSKMKYIDEEERLPSSLRGGFSLAFVEKASLSCDVHAPTDGDLSLHQGLEVGIGDQLVLRAGLKYLDQDIEETDKIGYNLGLGLVYGSGQFDYSFVPSGELGEVVHTFSLGFSW